MLLKIVFWYSFEKFRFCNFTYLSILLIFFKFHQVHIFKIMMRTDGYNFTKIQGVLKWADSKWNSYQTLIDNQLTLQEFILSSEDILYFLFFFWVPNVTEPKCTKCTELSLNGRMIKIILYFNNAVLFFSRLKK